MATYTTFHTQQEYKKYDIWMADLSLVVGSEQGGNRPVLLVQNNIGNRFSPTVIVAVISSKPKKQLPTHVYLDARLNGLEKDSVILTEQIRTIDKNRLMYKISTLHPSYKKLVNEALVTSFAIEPDMELCAV